MKQSTSPPLLNSAFLKRRGLGYGPAFPPVSRGGLAVLDVLGIAMSVGPSTVLVVDDDALVRAAARAILQQQGYAVRDACDGEAGLAAMAAEPSQIVLLDILMPRKEGLETLIELRRAYPATAVIAMSGSLVRKRNDFLGIAVKFGADSILRKPFTAEGLHAAISNGTAHRNHVQRLAANG